VGHRSAGSPHRAARALALWLALALAPAACSLWPGASVSPNDAALRKLAAQQAIWQSHAIDDYVITIERQCFCPGGQFVITVQDGIVVSVTQDMLPVRPDQVANVPKTVPELFALAAKLPPASLVSLSYDELLGFPMQLSVDPIPGAVDDEYSIVVHDFTRSS
jgi:hypothetical protein